MKLGYLIFHFPSVLTNSVFSAYAMNQQTRVWHQTNFTKKKNLEMKPLKFFYAKIHILWGVHKCIMNYLLLKSLKVFLSAFIRLYRPLKLDYYNIFEDFFIKKSISIRYNFAFVILFWQSTKNYFWEEDKFHPWSWSSYC